MLALILSTYIILSTYLAVGQYQDVIVEAATEDVPASLIAAVIYVESEGYEWAISPVGAVGLMQVLPYEYDPVMFATRPTAAELYDKRTNLRWGVLILEWHMYQCGDWLTGALATYAGAGYRDCTPTATGHRYAERVQELQRAYLWMDAMAVAD